MNKIILAVLSAYCLFAGCVSDGESTDYHYYVLNNSGAVISVNTAASDTSVTFANVEPAQRVLVGEESIPGWSDLSFFFELDSVMILRGDTVLDVYRATDTTWGRHIMRMSDYVEIRRTESDVDLVFTLFPQ